MSGAFYMNYSKSLLRKTLLIALILGIAVLGTGCSTKPARTVGLPGLTPLAGADQVKIIEKIDEVRQPYQIVGQVRLLRNQPLFEGPSYKHMKEIAAGMGADGLIGMQIGGCPSPSNTWLRYGLAVKWLAPGETKRDLAVPFVVAVLPVQDQAAPNKKTKISESWRSAISYQLGMKGYYVLPVQPDEENVQLLGGENAQLLFSLTIEASSNYNIVLLAGSSYSIKATLMDKRTRNTVFEGVGTGSFGSHGLVEVVSASSDLRNIYATFDAVQALLGKLPAINEGLPAINEAIGN
jgi:hypothetical protein